jgi:serine protease SohB
MSLVRKLLDRTPLADRLPAIVPVVRLTGIIAAGVRLGPRGLALENLAGTLERAFGMSGAKAVALAINSPGGSPVQSALIGGRIRQLALEKNLPVYAFVEDVAASGGYWLACAADEIWADSASIVGSIGVVSAGFGFQGLLRRAGIERRVHTAGERKSMLDPFQEEKLEDVVRLRRLQDEIHAEFIDWVKVRRASRLKPEALEGGETALFSGEFWTAQRALSYGLVDGIGHLRGVLRARFGEKVRTPVVGQRRGFLSRRLGLEAPVMSMVGLGDDLLAAVEERLWWQRFGL